MDTGRVGGREVVVEEEREEEETRPGDVRDDLNFGRLLFRTSPTLREGMNCASLRGIALLRFEPFG